MIASLWLVGFRRWKLVYKAVTVQQKQNNERVETQKPKEGNEDIQSSRWTRMKTLRYGLAESGSFYE